MFNGYFLTQPECIITLAQSRGEYVILTHILNDKQFRYKTHMCSVRREKNKLGLIEQ